MTTHNPTLVQEFRNTYIREELPKFLYHYTSIDIFKSIIDNGEIWATAVDYIYSDPSELTHAKKIALKVLEKRKETLNKKEEGLYDKCKEIINSYDELRNQNVCVFSFTEEEDLLSQWRGYCSNGGVSIGFSGNRIKNNTGNPTIINGTMVEKYHNDYIREGFLHKCIYDPKEQERIVNVLFDFLLEKAADFKVEGLLSKMLTTFTYTFKHESFKEEKEWRLVYWPEDNELKYRPDFKPYWPFLTIDHNRNSIISTIMLGPSPNKEILKKCISSYLKSQKSLFRIEVEVTDTPYLPN